MKYLVDTSVWGQVLLNQQGATEGKHFLAATPPSELGITLFAVYSLGLLCCRRRLPHLYETFVADVLRPRQVLVWAIDPPDLTIVIATMRATRLDFDDSYQYAVAEQHGLDIVSLDAHFDRTPRGRKSPAEVTP